MTKESGGAMSANTREGFRSETLARFALSAFGPATDVEVEDDYGIDLVCATAHRVGQWPHVDGGYLVQVKGDDTTESSHTGKHVRTWLEDLGNPLLICRVEKATTRIRLYSTWSISLVLLSLTADGGAEPETFRLLMDMPITLRPCADAIPLGLPIVDFKVTELHDKDYMNKLRDCVEQWVRMDSENIVRRRIGLAILHGYTEWETNKPQGALPAATQRCDHFQVLYFISNGIRRNLPDLSALVFRFRHLNSNRASRIGTDAADSPTVALDRWSSCLASNSTEAISTLRCPCRLACSGNGRDPTQNEEFAK